MDDFEVGSNKERDGDEKGMMYDRSARASTNTSMSEFDKDGEGEANEYGKGGVKERGDERGVNYHDYVRDTGMLSHALAPESPPAMS